MHKQIWIHRFLNKRNWLNLLLVLITLCAFLIRVHNITTNPIELFSDEITDFISAKSILEKGLDLDGKNHLYFYNKLELGAPVYGYISLFLSQFIKSDVLSIRLPAVIFGTLSVLIIFYLSRIIFNNNIVAITSACVVAFTPWSIHFGRVGWEPSILIFFTLLPILLFYNFIRKQQILYLYLSFLMFGFSVYVSQSSEFLSPFFMLLLSFIYHKDIRDNFKHFLFSLILFSIIILPFVYIFINEPLMHERAARISTFATGVTKENITVFINNYSSHLNPNFLLKTGDQNLRHGANKGVLYWSLIPLILVGLFKTIFNIKKREYIFIIIWLLAFPLGGSLTNDGVPHATRTLIGLPIFSILVGIGAYQIYTKHKLFLVPIIVLFATEVIIFSNYYFNIYPLKSQSSWEYGHKEVYSEIKRITKGNESLCLGNIDYWHEETLNIYYLGYNNDYKILYDINDPKCLASEILVLPPHNIAPKKYATMKVIYDLESNPKWIIYKNNL